MPGFSAFQQQLQLAAAASPSTSPAFAQRDMASAKKQEKSRGRAHVQRRKKGQPASPPLEPRPEPEPASTPVIETEPKAALPLNSPAAISPISQDQIDHFLDHVRTHYLLANDSVSRNYFIGLCTSYNSDAVGEVGFYTDVLRLLRSSGADELNTGFKALVPRSWRGDELAWLDGAVEADAQVLEMMARMRMRILEKLVLEDDAKDEDEEMEEAVSEPVDEEVSKNVREEANEDVNTHAKPVPEATSEDAMAFNAEGPHMPASSESERQKWSDLGAFLAAEATPSSSSTDSSSPTAGIAYHDMAGTALISHMKNRKIPINGYRATQVSHIEGYDGTLLGSSPGMEDSSLRRMASDVGISPVNRLRVSFYSKLSEAKSKPEETERTPEKKASPSRKSLIIRLPISPSIKGETVTPSSVASAPAPHARDATTTKKAPASKTSSPSPRATKLTTRKHAATAIAGSAHRPLPSRSRQAVYATPRAILARPLIKPYVHALCGQRFGHYNEVQRHHNGQSGRPGCWEKHGKPAGAEGRWDRDPTCQWTLKDLVYRAVEGGFVVDDWGSVGNGVDGILEDRSTGVKEKDMSDDAEEREAKRRRVRHSKESTPAATTAEDSCDAAKRQSSERPVKRRKVVEDVDIKEVKAEEGDLAALRSAATGLRKHK